jgi:hypothetical protein
MYDVPSSASRACAPVETMIWGNGVGKCTDAVMGSVAIDCKSLKNPNKSPQLGNAPPLVIAFYTAKELKLLAPYEKLISDPCSGFTRLVIRVEDPRQVPFWTRMLSTLTIPTAIQVVP